MCKKNMIMNIVCFASGAVMTYYFYDKLKKINDNEKNIIISI